MLPGLQQQLCRAAQHLRSVGQRLVPRQAAGHAAVGESLQKQRGKGRAAAGHGGARVQQMLLQPGRPSRVRHRAQEVLLLRLRHLAAAVVENQPLAHRHRRVGHDADDRVAAAEGGLDRLDRRARKHRHQHRRRLPRAQRVADLIHHRFQQIRLDAEEQIVRARRGGHVVHHLARAAQRGKQALRLFRMAVGQKQRVFRVQRGSPRQRAAHVSRADKSQLSHHDSSFTMRRPFRRSAVLFRPPGRRFPCAR